MWRRIFSLTTFSLVLVALVGFAAIQIQQRVLRFRAAHLLSELRAIELRRNTWADAQTLMARWGAWGHYDGSCTSNYCEYTIRLADFSYSHPRFIPASLWFRRQYGRIGARMSVVTADFLVFNGLIWKKGYSLEVAVPPEVGPEAPFAGNGYTLMGSAEGVSRFLAGYSPAPASHPQYKIGTPYGCTGCLAVWVSFTPYGNPAEIQRLMNINLDCITRWNPCREKGDIMPSAWRQYIAESVLQDHSIKNCTYPLEWLARDADNVATVDVISNRIQRENYSFQVSTVRLVERLKAASFWEIGTTREVRVFPGTVNFTHMNSRENVSPGKRFIVLFQHSHRAGPSGPEVWPVPCGIVPLNAMNRQAITLGAAQDFSASLRQKN
jgi:hypothetical protein